MEMVFIRGGFVCCAGHTFPINAMDAEGNTFLHLVAARGFARNIRELISWGARPGIRNKRGLTALDVAAVHGHHKAIRAFFQMSGVALLNGRDPWGYTALLRAINYGQGLAIDMLLKLGATASGRDIITRETSLQFAAQNGLSTTIGARLVRAGALVDDQDGIRETALHRTASVGDVLGAQTLLGLGASLFVGNISGNIPIYMAAMQRSIAVMRLFISSVKERQDNLLLRTKNNKGDDCLAALKRYDPDEPRRAPWELIYAWRGMQLAHRSLQISSYVVMRY